MAELTPGGGAGGGGGMPDLFAKIGPLPAWAWGALAVVGYIWWSHGRSASNTTATATDTADTTDTGTVPDVTTSNDYGYSTATDPSSAGYDYSTVNAGGYSGSVSGTAYGSNQQWAVAAIQTLINSGVPASTATTGITLYLSGSNITQDEANAVNTAIGLIGPPPLPMPINLASGTTATQPGTDTTPTPTPQPAPVPVVSTTPAPVTGASIMQGTLSGYQYDSAGNQISGPYQGIPGANGLGFMGSTTSIAPGQPGYVDPMTPQTQAPGWYDTDAQGRFLSGDKAAYDRWAAANPQFVH